MSLNSDPNRYVSPPSRHESVSKCFDRVNKIWEECMHETKGSGLELQCEWQYEDYYGQCTEMEKNIHNGSLKPIDGSYEIPIKY